MAFHPEGELPVYRAARAKNVVQVLSTNANASIAKAAETRGGPVWYQLYAPSKWEFWSSSCIAQKMAAVR